MPCQAHLLADRARLFTSALHSLSLHGQPPPTHDRDAESELRQQCLELRAQIDQVNAGTGLHGLIAPRGPVYCVFDYCIEIEPSSYLIQFCRLRQTALIIQRFHAQMLRCVCVCISVCVWGVADERYGVHTQNSPAAMVLHQRRLAAELAAWQKQQADGKAPEL